MEEMAALAVVGDTLAEMAERGPEYFPPSEAAQATMRKALAALYTLPDASVIADALVQQSFACVRPALEEFQNTLLDMHAVPLEALRRLHARVSVAQTTLADWCASLTWMEGLDDFHGLVRCALLQLDAVSGEAPPGRGRLLAFIRDHCTQFLLRKGDEQDTLGEVVGDHGLGVTASRDDDEEEEREASPVLVLSSQPETSRQRRFNDELLSLLHQLHLAESDAIRALLFDVLDDSIQRRLRGMDVDFTEHCVRACLAWQNAVIEPFIALCLCGDSQGRARGSAGGGLATTSLGGFPSPAARNEMSLWSGRLRARLLHQFARSRIAALWDIFVDFPDSIPALDDLRSCLQHDERGELKALLLGSARALLASRLHRAGTRTEDILAMLIKAVSSLCVLLPRNERSTAVLSVVGATLDHLRRRRDCVPAVVQVITHADSALYADLRPAGGAGAGSFIDDGGAAAEEGAVGEARERPDVLRVLLTAIPVRDLVREYRHVLGEQLLGKAPNDFDTIGEEEVLERLKCTFGEPALVPCVVMIRDMQMSRRVTQQLREAMVRQRERRRAGSETFEVSVHGEDAEEEPRGRGSVVLPALAALQQRLRQRPPAARENQEQEEEEEPLAATGSSSGGGGGGNSDYEVPAESLGATIVSSSCWPKLSLLAGGSGAATRALGGAAAYAPARVVERFAPHPSLQRCMDDMARHFKTMRANQKLLWSLPQSRVSIEVEQLDAAKPGAPPVQTPLTASLLCASAVLYVAEMGADAAGVPAARVAERLEVPAEALLQELSLAAAAVVDCSDPNALRMRRYVRQAGSVVFAEAQEEQEEAVPGLEQEQIKMLQKMITSMLKTRGAKSLADIHNSMKMFGQFTGSAAEMKKLLQKFIKDGVLAQNDAKLYTLPAK